MAEKPTYQELEKRIRELARDAEARRPRPEPEPFEKSGWYRTLFDDNSSPIAIIDPSGRYLDANQAFIEFVESDKDTLLRMSVFDFTLPENRRREEKTHKPLWKSGGMRETEYLVNGRVKTLELSIAPVVFHGADAVIGIGKDVTERIAAEKALRESESLKNAILNASLDSIRFVDQEMRIIWANKITEKQTGKTAAEIVGAHCYSLFTGRDSPCPNCPTLKSLESGETEHSVISETDVKGIKGPSYWADYAVPIKNDSGVIVNFIQVSHEITELIETQQSLERSEKKFRSMMEAMKDGACICSSSLVVEYMNPVMVRKVGRDAVGDRCHEVFHDLNERCPWCVFDKILKGAHVDYEYCDPKRNRCFAVSNSPIRHSDGKISKLTLFRDITETKAMEAQLRHARKMESIGTMAGGIAHDFNNLLYMITGNTELAMEDLPEWNPVHKYLMEIKTAGLRAAGIVRQLLEFSRKTEPEMRRIDVTAVIRDSISLLRSSIPSTIEIRTSIPDTETWIVCDPVQINQTLMNLCANAAQAMETSGGVLEISVDATVLDREAILSFPDLSPGKFVEITIRDTGPGINPEFIDRIFDPYFTTKDIGKGSGLGLSVVHGIVRNHNGAVSVESEPGKGAAFHMLFPAAPEPTAVA